MAFIKLPSASHIRSLGTGGSNTYQEPAVRPGAGSSHSQEQGTAVPWSSQRGSENKKEPRCLASSDAGQEGPGYRAREERKVRSLGSTKETPEAGGVKPFLQAEVKARAGEQ